MQINNVGYNYGYSNQKTQRNNNQTSFGQLKVNEMGLRRLNEALFSDPEYFRKDQARCDMAIEKFEAVLSSIAQKWKDVTNGLHRGDVSLEIYKQPDVPGCFRVIASSLMPNQAQPTAAMYKISKESKANFSALRINDEAYGTKAGRELSDAVDGAITELRASVPQTQVDVAVKRQLAMFDPSPTPASK